MTLPEVLIASALTASLGATVVLVMAPADAAVRAEQDAVDVQQRQRVLADALTSAVMAAADVTPIADGLTLVTRDANGVEIDRRTFVFRRATHQVMQVDGDGTTPLVDRVTDVAFTVVDVATGRVRVTATIESPATSGRSAAPRPIAFDVVPRRGR